MNIKHPITPSSPLSPSNLALTGLNMVRVSLSCTDSNGLPVNETMAWYDKECIFMGDYSLDLFREKGVRPPLVLRGAKWRDAYAMFDDPVRLPRLSVDLNNFTRAVVSEPPTTTTKGDDNV